MSLLNFSNFEVKSPRNRKNLKLVLCVSALVGVVALGSTLAASINLNSNNPVEFGQGVAQTTACDSEILITPYSQFENGDPGAFMFSGLMLSQVDTTDQSESSDGCAGKSFLIASTCSLRLSRGYLHIALNLRRATIRLFHLW